MSSVTRRFQVRNGEVAEVTHERPNIGAGSSAGLCGGCPSAYRGDRPGKSLAMGCHSTEIGLMNERIRREGIVGVEYVPQRNRRGEVIGGKCVITNNSRRTGRRAWMKAYGRMTIGEPLHDEDSFD